jgi:hypothetical protein
MVLCRIDHAPNKLETHASPRVQVSVLLATCHRAELLGQTLAAMARLSTAGLTWE